MKYLIKYPKELVIAICVVIALIVISILAIKSGDYKAVGGAFVNDVLTLLGLYFNMPTSAEGDSAKIDMLQNKRNRHNPIECDEPEEE